MCILHVNIYIYICFRIQAYLFIYIYIYFFTYLALVDRMVYHNLGLFDMLIFKVPPRSSIALLKWCLPTDVRGVWDTTTSEPLFPYEGCFGRCCHVSTTACLKARASFVWECFRLPSAVAMGANQQSYWTVHDKYLNLSSFQLNYSTILWWSITI